MARSIRGNRPTGYDYGSKRIGNNCYSNSPDRNTQRTSTKAITVRRERAKFRSHTVKKLINDL